ncbi:hypothetical protein E9993_08985 [Labilibacter sediminis]|nr:hypothetical protein E9993_08985 [Labilibacter sediminis]
MKKMVRLTFLVLVAVFYQACSEQEVVEQMNNLEDEILKGKKMEITENMESAPNSQDGVVPFIIPGENRGGNRTCAEVGLAFVDDAEYFALCGDKIDYNDGEFNSKFPEALNVSTDGTYVSFELDGCIEMNGEYYKVGAVIVKGSNDANVYFYPEGSMGDEGLAAPINSSGKPAGLSNLTFCFVKCDAPEWVIVLKTYLQCKDESFWAVTRGEGSDINTLRIGYNEINGEEITLYKWGYESMPIGSIVVSEMMENGVKYLIVELTTTLECYMFSNSYLYVGTAEGYSYYLKDRNGKMETQFGDFPFIDNNLLKTKVFKIPFPEIVE